MSEIRAAAMELTAVLESLSIAYAIGGSFASSVHGIARPTQDLDVVAALLPGHVDRFAAALEKDFYVDAGRSFNVIHFKSGFKIDIFPASSHALGRQQLARRRTLETTILGGLPAPLPVISPEDTMLVKLRWYRDGGEASERQWNDLRNLVEVQRTRLDVEYLEEWARVLGVAEYWSACWVEKRSGVRPARPSRVRLIQA